jgi:glutamate synthase (NADPH/NADH) small chain
MSCSETNDFPEFTGRVCPGLCEKACVLNLMEHEPTTNRENEAAIAEYAYNEDFVHPHIPTRNGKKVAVVGAGPSGLSVATQLNQKGYEVTVFDAREDAGGLLRFGIPNFKLNKAIIDRKMDILKQEGIKFEFGVMLVPVNPTEPVNAFRMITRWRIQRRRPSNSSLRSMMLLLSAQVRLRHAI